jgi:DNA (cytosine-5)-methyltransferase 1
MSDRGRSDSLATVSTLDIYVGDDLLDLATTIASLAYHQALELRDLISARAQAPCDRERDHMTQSDRSYICRGPGCAIAIDGRARRGRRPRFCSVACKQRAYRRRQRCSWRAAAALRNAPVALDLFCCEGGAGAGYAAAGFRVIGVDLVDQPRYPFEFHQGDALELLPWLILRYAPALIHASPPCQVHSSTRNFGYAGRHVDLIPQTRAALEMAALPAVIENVVGAPLVDPVKLCGAMFGLGTYRHRLFELHGWACEPPGHPRHQARAARMGYAPATPWEMHTICGNFKDTPRAREAMAVGWMSRRGLSQAIPPAYTAWLGGAFLQAASGAE